MMMTKRRCHYSMFIISTIKSIWAVLTAIIFFLIDAGLSRDMLSGMSRTQILIFVALLAMALLVLIVNFLRWRKTFVYVEGDNFVVDRRTINRSKSTVKLSTIAAVNVRQGLLERLFGSYRLQLDINSAATANKTDFDLVFTKREAHALRARLIADSGQQAAAPGLSAGGERGGDQLCQAMESAPAADMLCAFSFSQVMRHCLLSLQVSGIFFAAIGIGGWFWNSGATAGAQISSLALLMAFLPPLYQMVTPFFRYQNFRVLKRGGYLEVTYGLIATQHYSLPLDKTNAIIIRRPMLARFFGLCSGEIVNVGMGDAKENQAPLFCLLTTPAELRRVIAAIAPAFAETAEGGRAWPLPRSPRQALLPALISWGLPGLAALLIGIIWGKWWAGAAVCVLLLLAGYLQWRTKELVLLTDKIGISSGIFAKRSITADYAKLQCLTRKQGPISRYLGLSRGSVTMLAQSNNLLNPIGYFPSSQFDRIGEEMVRAGEHKRGAV
ncbi:MAG: PH domain-containing protein [Clostridia bacterium]|nr:PH domain-containing protein [Clostridia bacterium]